MQKIFTSKQSREQSAESRTSTQRDTLPQSDSQVTHTQPEGQSAYPPKNTIDNGRNCTTRTPQLQQTTSGRYAQKRPQQGENQPSKNSLNEPEALPRPVLHFIDGHIRTTLPEAANRYNQQSYQCIHAIPFFAFSRKGQAPSDTCPILRHLLITFGSNFRFIFFYFCDELLTYRYIVLQAEHVPNCIPRQRLGFL